MNRQQNQAANTLLISFSVSHVVVV